MFARTVKNAAADTSTTERAAASAARIPMRVRSENRSSPWNRGEEPSGRPPRSGGNPMPGSDDGQLGP